MALLGFNFFNIHCEYFKSETLSCAFSNLYEEYLFIKFQISFIKIMKFMQLPWRKIFNSSQSMRTTILFSWISQRLYCIQIVLILLQKKKPQTIYNFIFLPAESKKFSHYRQNKLKSRCVLLKYTAKIWVSW